MQEPDNSAHREYSRAATVVAALLYLMTHYTRTGCPRLALCVSRHLQFLASHAEAPPVVRDMCAGLHEAWHEAACGKSHGGEIVH